MKTFRHALHLMRVNLFSLLFFEVLYKLFAIALPVPAVLLLFRLSQRLAGLRYLTAEDIGIWLHCPWTWCLLALILILIVLFCMVDVTAVVYCLDCSRLSARITPMNMLQAGLGSLYGLFRHGDLLPFSYVLVSIPLTFTIFLSGYLPTFSIPAFLSACLQRSAGISTLTVIALICALLAALPFAFSLHARQLEHMSFGQALRSSAQLVEGCFPRLLAQLLLWSLAVLAAHLLLVLASAVLVTALCAVFSAHEHILTVSLRIVSGAVTVLTVVFSALLQPLLYAFLSAFWYRRRSLRGEPVRTFSFPLPRARLRHRRIAAILIFVLLVGLDSLILSGISSDRLAFTTERTSSVTVTAHRGASKEAPENTLEAFEAAMEDGVDCIELDVQLTADGVPVVCHDTNLLRTTGLDANIRDLTWDQLKDLDCGSWMGDEWSGCRIPTLRQVLDLCRGRVHLNIELKGSHPEKLIEPIYELLEEYGITGSCELASTSYQVLEQIRASHPEVRTIYIMSLAYGSIEGLDAADACSIQAACLTDTLTEQLHDEGLLVYAWTVNSASVMEKLIDMDVNCIITDDPQAAIEVTLSHKLGGVLSSCVRHLLVYSEQ